MTKRLIISTFVVIALVVFCSGPVMALATPPGEPGQPQVPQVSVNILEFGVKNLSRPDKDKFAGRHKVRYRVKFEVVGPIWFHSSDRYQIVASGQAKGRTDSGASWKTDLSTSLEVSAGTYTWTWKERIPKDVEPGSSVTVTIQLNIPSKVIKVTKFVGKRRRRRQVTYTKRVKLTPPPESAVGETAFNIFPQFNVPGDYQTIQAAIDAVDPIDIVKINVAAGTYNENIEIYDKQDLSLIGVKGTVISPGNNMPCINIVGSSAVLIRGFEMTQGSEGVRIEESKNITIKKCRAQGNETGTYILRSDNTKIINNTIQENEKEGVHIEESEITVIQGCSIKGHEIGIYVYLSDNTKIINNTIQENEKEGVHIEESKDTTIQDCSIESNETGIDILRSDNTKIEGSTIKGNGTGIYTLESDTTEIGENNIIVDNAVGKAGDKWKEINVPGDYQTIQEAVDGLESNFITEIKVASGTYNENVEIISIQNLTLTGALGAVINPNNNGPCIRIANSSAVVIDGFEITQGGEGIFVEESNDVEIRECYIHGNDTGIYVYLSDNTKINMNTILSNTDNGVEVFYSKNCLIKKNDIAGNGDYGVFVDSSDEGRNAPDVVDATGNWWGDKCTHPNVYLYGQGYDSNYSRKWWGDRCSKAKAPGPYYAPLRRTGSGDKVSDYVKYDPWLSKVRIIGAIVNDGSGRGSRVYRGESANFNITYEIVAGSKHIEYNIFGKATARYDTTPVKRDRTFKSRDVVGRGKHTITIPGKIPRWAPYKTSYLENKQRRFYNLGPPCYGWADIKWLIRLQGAGTGDPKAIQHKHELKDRHGFRVEDW